MHYEQLDSGHAVAHTPPAKTAHLKGLCPSAAAATTTAHCLMRPPCILAMDDQLKNINDQLNSVHVLKPRLLAGARGWGGACCWHVRQRRGGGGANAHPPGKKRERGARNCPIDFFNAASTATRVACSWRRYSAGRGVQGLTRWGVRRRPLLLSFKPCRKISAGLRPGGLPISGVVRK